MRKVIPISAVAFFCISAICGCGNAEDADTAAGEEANGIVRVGDAVLSAEKFSQLIKYARDTAEISVKAKKDKRWEQRFYSMATNAVIARFRIDEMIKADAKARGLGVPSQSVVDSVNAKFGKRFRGLNGDLKAIRLKFDALGDGEAFGESYTNAVITENYLQTYYGEDLKVTEENISTEIEGVRAINHTIALTNAYFAAVATNVWEQLRQGKAFAEVHDRFSTEDKEDWRTGGLQDEPLSAVDFDDMPESWAAMRKLKVGEWTPLIENDYGYFIYKLEGDAEYEDSALTSAKFARIWIRKAMPALELNREQTRKALEKRFRDFVMRKVFEDLSKKVKFVCLRPDVFTLDEKPSPQTDDGAK